MGEMKIDGSLSEEQEVILDSLRGYCKNRIAPSLDEWIREREFPRWLMKDLSKLFLPSTIQWSENERMDEVTLGLISEEMGKSEFPVPAFLTVHFAKMLPLIKDPDTRSSFVNRYFSGSLVICGAFTEPGAGSDAASIRTSAKVDGNTLRISGEKSFVSSPGIADAYIISAKTNDGSNRGNEDGISLMIFEAGKKGLENYELESMASIFKGDFGGIRINDLEISDGNMIGPVNKGFRTLMRILNTQRVHVALYSLGLAERSLEEAVEYAKTRKTFNEPISRREAVSFRLAEDWTKIESARLLAYKALALQEKGVDNTAECAGVKWYACEVAFEAVSHALQTFGASGYVKPAPVERRFRAARGFLIGDGTPDVQKIIISRKLFGKDYAPL